MTRWKRAARTAYLTNNVVHSPREYLDNGRAARYITGAIIIICKPPPRASFSYLSREGPPTPLSSTVSRNGSPVYRDESGPGFDETSVTNDPDSRPALFLSFPLSFSASKDLLRRSPGSLYLSLSVSRSRTSTIPRSLCLPRLRMPGEPWESLN